VPLPFVLLYEELPVTELLEVVGRYPLERLAVLLLPYLGEVLVLASFEVLIDLLLLVILELLDHGETTATSGLLSVTVSVRTGSRTIVVFPRSCEMVLVAFSLPFLEGFTV